jgi:hypothetical protein
MSDPLLYIVSYRFSDFQANSPASPLPAPPLDNELAGIAAAVAGLVASIKDVRRSDGKLNNGVVTFDSFELGLRLTVDPTNGLLVAAAVAGAQASATSAGVSATAASASAAAALVSQIAAAASASSVNLTLYLPKAGNLAGLADLPTSRTNLGLGSVAILNVGNGASNIVQLDGSAKLPALDGSQLINIDTLPVGTTIWVNGNAAPAGFLKSNGALISRVSFPRLYAFAAGSGNIVSEATWAAGSQGAFSTGDLASTFRIPDDRGEFIRAFDDGRGVDSGRSISAHQADSLKDHTHVYQKAGGGGISSGTGLYGFDTALTGSVTTSGASTGTATETRPRNNAKLACIKY